jgi:hypothetical protein
LLVTGVVAGTVAYFIDRQFLRHRFKDQSPWTLRYRVGVFG